MVLKKIWINEMMNIKFTKKSSKVGRLESLTILYGMDIKLNGLIVAGDLQQAPSAT